MILIYVFMSNKMQMTLLEYCPTLLICPILIFSYCLNHKSPLKNLNLNIMKIMLGV